MSTPPLDIALVVESPELVALDVLGHALDAARRSLALFHPEIHQRGHLGELADECHFAVCIAHELDELEKLMASYRAAVEAAFAEDLARPDAPPRPQRLRHESR
jgi:hypothetical protein